MTFKIPREDRYFEDYVTGVVHEFGGVEVVEDEMVAFARRFDPQPFHTDPDAAKESVFGGLIASGWFTASLIMRLLVDNYVSRVASLGSPGVDELRWLKPVRPGDTLSARITVLETQRSRSKPDQGFIRTFVEVLNQNSDLVMTIKSVGFVRCRYTMELVDDRNQRTFD
jgi:acyl dehydratase